MPHFINHNKVDNTTENKIHLYNSGIKPELSSDIITLVEKTNNRSEKTGVYKKSAENMQWINSTYTYNKSYAKAIPVADRLINNLIKNYFNLNLLKNNQKSRRIQIRFKRLSLNRILVSKAETKHLNNKAIVTIYI